MSTESPDTADNEHERGDPTVDAILADLREAEIDPRENLTHDLTTAEVARLDVRETLPHVDIEVTAEEVGLGVAHSRLPRPRRACVVVAHRRR